MSLTHILNNVFQYLAEGLVRTFSPSDDQYPVIGVQPFGGDICNYFDW